MAKVVTGADRDRVTVNTNNVWERIVGIENSLDNVETNYTPRLTSVESSLAQNVSQLTSLELANAKDDLSIINYLGNNQNIHPKVLYFPDGWNGYKYWMAYTPYPFGDTTAENPCIAVSNDMFTWTVPAGLTNPLDPAPTEGYNSDTHLVYREDINTLEIWWRQANDATSTAILYRRTTTNGVNWTAKETMFTLTPLSQKDMLSPSVIFENGVYKIWSILSQTSTLKKVRYTQSLDSSGTTWTTPTESAINWGDSIPWHLDVIKTDLGYEMIVTAYKEGGSNNTADLYYLIQKFDGSFTVPELILKRSKNKTSIDYSGIYRSCLLKIDSQYYVFYSSIGADSGRHMTLAWGSNIFGLNGYAKLDKKPNSRVARIAGGSTLTDYDISNIDVLIFTGTSLVTVNSFKGGYEGKPLAILVEGSNASGKFVYGTGSRLLLPGLKDYTLNTGQMGMYLVCTNTAGTTFRAIADPGAPNSTYIRLTDPAVSFIDYDVSAWDTIAFQSSVSAFTLESLSGGYVGKKIDLMVIGSTTQVIIKNNARIVTPSGSDYTLTTTQTGVRLICTATGLYRLIV